MNIMVRRNLIFARVGDHSLHKNFLAEPCRERNWDLQLSAFGNDVERVRDDGDLPLSIDRGTKWDSVLRYFTANPQLLDRYDYIMFPDDDVLFESSMSLDRFFDICHEFDLTIAQPACTSESYVSLPIFARCPMFRLRFTTIVECMVPCVKSSYLKSTILPLYQKWITGWATDQVAALLMPDPAFKAAIIDEVPMTHTRPFFAGAIYSGFKSLSVSPQLEIQQVLASYQNRPPGFLVYGAVLKNGQRVGGSIARIINGLHLLKKFGAPLSKNSDSMVRAALGMLVRAITLANYMPVQVLPVEPRKHFDNCYISANFCPDSKAAPENGPQRSREPRPRRQTCSDCDQE